MPETSIIAPDVTVTSEAEPPADIVISDGVWIPEIWLKPAIVAPDTVAPEATAIAPPLTALRLSPCAPPSRFSVPPAPIVVSAAMAPEDTVSTVPDVVPERLP